jgi:hypothetical protein
VIGYCGGVAIKAGDVLGGSTNVDASSGNPDAVYFLGVVEVLPDRFKSVKHTGLGCLTNTFPAPRLCCNP